MSHQTADKYDLLDRASPLLRFLGHDQPARAVVDHALQAGRLPIQIRPVIAAGTQPETNDSGNTHLIDRYDAHADPTLIDTSLTIAESVETTPDPSLGVGYAGLTPQQRHRFLAWSATPTKPAPPAFRHLYVASLEVRLLENNTMLLAAHKELVTLGLRPSWNGSSELARAVLLGFWFRQDGVGLAKWIEIGAVPTEQMGIALGLQTLLKQPLTAEQLAQVMKSWNLPASQLTQDVLRMRLSSLHRSVGAEPLAYTLEQLSDKQRGYAPWRCAHRDIRIAVPQPDLRPHLEPLLADMLALMDLPTTSHDGRVIQESTPGYESLDEDVQVNKPQYNTMQNNVNQDAPVDDAPSLDELGWRLILQFGQSRSEFFQYALDQCQRLSGFTQLMDENRQMVYRVVFKKNEMRKFWRIWDYVQNWSSTTVYLNGEELEKWKIWPYSQYLQQKKCKETYNDTE